MTNLLSERARRMRREKQPGEEKLWSLLRELNGFGFHFRQQAPIGPYIADFCDHTAKVIVESDGSQHDAPKQRASDQSRTQWLNSQGYRVLRFWNHEILSNIGGVEIEIKVALGLLTKDGQEPRAAALIPSPLERLRKKAQELQRTRRPRKTRSTGRMGQRASHNTPSPLVGEGQGGGDGGTSNVGVPPTPSPSPQGGGGSRWRLWPGNALAQGGQNYG
jgi:very-short-patch-repair endonuclease